jgi:NAD(P)H dehydrogenase (quinone)
MKISIVFHSETGNTEKMAEWVERGCQMIDDIETKCMSVDAIDAYFLRESKAVIFGSPTYEGGCSWRMKKYLDVEAFDLGGKLGGVFASQNWPGGGGASFAEMVMIAALLVRGMIVYSGGIATGKPFLHFGAVSTRAPEDDFYQQRCLKLGQNIAKKARELFS